VLFPLEVTVPRGILLLLAAAPVLSGVALISGTTSRIAGVVLLAGFTASMWYLVRASRDHDFLRLEDEIREETTKPLRWWQPAALTAFGLVVITIGAELVNYGADSIIRHFAFPAGLMGMIITPAAIEAEEVIRQAVPAKQGRHDIAAGNLIGTVLYFVLFNLGLIAVAVPVPVPHRVVVLDWPFLIGSAWLATAFLWRGRVTRIQGAVLLAVYGAYIVASFLLEP
jgi:cation:H+ antiporter